MGGAVVNSAATLLFEYKSIFFRVALTLRLIGLGSGRGAGASALVSKRRQLSSVGQSSELTGRWVGWLVGESSELTGRRVDWLVAELSELTGR